ncbi:hypothetical protein P4679_24565 [Priestia megaterium]|uniref:hypothetical protein n=1 Tax=Priestia megaterium TaxID=1404 RepID=UPI002E22FFF3|nr:hypothetical protein [Priestia megaterium]
MISLMILMGLFLMGAALFVKKKSLEKVFISGQDNIVAGIIALIFLNAPIKIQRIMLFTFGLVWSGGFAYFLITGKY